MTHRSITAILILVGFFSIFIMSGFVFAPNNPSDSASAAAQTPAVTPTGAATVKFNAASIQKNTPAEVISQIDLRLGGGRYPGCLDIPEEPTLDYKNDNLELTEIAIITSCGWQPGEIVKVTLMDPQGKFSTTEVQAVPARQKKSVYEVDVFFQPGADAQVGKYRFTFEGTSGAWKDSAPLKAKITYNHPASAKLYALPVDRFQPHFSTVGGQHRLRLQGFLPNEPVRLLAYTVDGTQNKFYAWQDFTTDRRGRLIIETDIPEIDKTTEMNFYVYGRDTHFIPLERFTPDGLNVSRQFDMDLYCPGVKAPRLNGPAGIRPAAGVSRLDVHQQPGFGSRVTTQVAASAAAETGMQVYGYPKCIDRAFWWKVVTGRPYVFGWVAESFLGKYLVEPITK